MTAEENKEFIQREFERLKQEGHSPEYISIYIQEMCVSAARTYMKPEGMRWFMPEGAWV